MVPHGYGLRAVAVEKLVEPRIPQLTAGHLHRLARSIATCRHIEVFHIHLRVESLAHRGGMPHVTHRLLAAQVEVAVRRPAVVAQVDEHGKQRHRVGAPAESDHHGCIAPKQSVSGDKIGSLLPKIPDNILHFCHFLKYSSRPSGFFGSKSSSRTCDGCTNTGSTITICVPSGATYGRYSEGSIICSSASPRALILRA